jgi:peptidoglycan hydrolase-like amidase
VPSVDYRYLGVPAGPTLDYRRRSRRRWPLVMAAVVALAAAPFTTLPAAVSAAVPCASHRSDRRPPTYIRVLITQTGRVHRVPFRTYVERVASSEWGSTPPELRKAGIVAVKQYGWSRVINWHGRYHRGVCFHVFNNTRDQIYKPSKRPPAEVRAAVHAAWRLDVRRRDGSLVHTGYRTGAQGVACGRDGGVRLYARSAKRCALRGWSASQILHHYYRHRL